MEKDIHIAAEEDCGRDDLEKNGGYMQQRLYLTAKVNLRAMGAQ